MYSVAPQDPRGGRGVWTSTSFPEWDCLLSVIQGTMLPHLYPMWEGQEWFPGACVVCGIVDALLSDRQMEPS